MNHESFVCHLKSQSSQINLVFNIQAIQWSQSNIIETNSLWNKVNLIEELNFESEVKFAVPFVLFP